MEVLQQWATMYMTPYLMLPACSMRFITILIHCAFSYSVQVHETLAASSLNPKFKTSCNWLWILYVATYIRTSLHILVWWHGTIWTYHVNEWWLYSLLVHGRCTCRAGKAIAPPLFWDPYVQINTNTIQIELYKMPYPLNSCGMCTTTHVCPC